MPNTPTPTMIGRVRHFGALAASIGLIVTAAACGDDYKPAATSDRPTVTFTATDTTLTAPKEVPAGFVDVQINSIGTIGHHLFFARLNDGVTLEQVQAADEQGGSDAFFAMMTVHGGNGTVAPGQDVSMTLDLKPGNYFALDNPQNESSPTAAPSKASLAAWARSVRANMPGSPSNRAHPATTCSFASCPDATANHTS
jgi:hypothetical protein